MSLQPQPPAAWYDDPQQPGMLRYWDGETWTDHTAPAMGPSVDTAPGPEPAPAAAGTGYAWALALTPVAWLLMDVVLLLLDVGGAALPVTNAVALALNLALAKADSARLDAVGVRLSAWWAFLLAPVYLILRTVRARSSAGIPVLWFVLTVAYAGAVFAMPLTSEEEREAWAEAFASYGCEDLAGEAVTMSKDGKKRLALRDIRDTRVVEDNTDTFELPDADDEVLVLACQGQGVWADDGSSTQLRLELTLDSAGETWIAYNPVGAS